MDGRGVTPQNEIRWQNQITLTVVSISNNFRMGCDPPIDYQNKLFNLPL